MKWIGLALMGLLFLGQSAAAGPTWSAFAFTTTPQNAPQVVAATDKFMNSAIGKEFPGRLMLHMYMANGTNPATHALAPFYKSAADREAYGQNAADRSFASSFVSVLRSRWPNYHRLDSSLFPPAGGGIRTEFVQLHRYSWLHDFLYFPHPTTGVVGRRFELWLDTEELEDPVFVKFKVE